LETILDNRKSLLCYSDDRLAIKNGL
jgi:hypothetical protein